MTVRDLIALISELPLDSKVLYEDDGFYREVEEIEARTYGSPGGPDTTDKEKTFILLL